MKKGKITKLKYENIIFIILVSGSVFNATLIGSNGVFGVYSAIITLLVQIGMWELVRYGIRYIRKNPQTVANEIASLFKDN
ncbi:MAG: hypothetical protein PHU05_04215 [Bacilli bacterium]|nr:hypothetical protein [Bacilli bacterium]